MVDIVELKRMLVARSQAVAEHLLPGGKREGHEWRAGSIDGERGSSLGVHLDGPKAGIWSDFATGQSGDLIDLWVAVKRLDLAAALEDIRAWLGVSRAKVHQAKRPKWKRPTKPTCTTPERRALEYLRENRNVPMEFLLAYKIGEDEQQRIIFPFLLPDGTLVMAKRRDSVDGAKPVPTEGGCEAILFGWQAMPANARTVVICEGEIDALSWAAYGYPALSVPYGGGGGEKQKWIENEFDRLDRFERILLALDMDGPGDEAAAEIANRLGHHRCLRVSTPLKDGNACLMEGVPKSAMDQAIADATWFEVAGLGLPSGFADKVTNLFWPRAGERIGYRTPYGKLGDKLLFRPGEVTIWTGDTGAGKTQVISDCITDWVKQGSRICLSSLEMAPAYTLKRLVKQVAGTDRPTEEAIRAALDWLSGGLLVFELVGKSKLDEMLAVFDYARSRYGADKFVIDSLMRLGVAGDDYNGQEQVVYRVVDWAIAASVHVHLVAHAKKGERERGVPGIEDVKGAMEIGANAFNIISIWRNRKFEDEVAKLRTDGDNDGADRLRKEKPGVVLNVAKQRNGDFEGKIGLWFDQKTYRYRSSADDAAWKRTYLPEGWNAAP